MLSHQPPTFKGSEMCELNSALLSEREVATAGAVARVVYFVFEVIVMVFFFFLKWCSKLFRPFFLAAG